MRGALHGDDYGDGAAASERRPGVPSPSAADPMVPKEVHREHKESYVHSTAAFLEDGQLQPGTTGRYDAALMIQPEPSAHADKATRISWRLVTTVDIARARDTARDAVEHDILYLRGTYPVIGPTGLPALC